MKVLVLHGVNLDMFGKRDPAQYGTITLAEIDAQLQSLAAELERTSRPSRRMPKERCASASTERTRTAPRPSWSMPALDALQLRDPRRARAPVGPDRRGSHVQRSRARGVPRPFRPCRRSQGPDRRVRRRQLPAGVAGGQRPPARSSPGIRGSTRIQVWPGLPRSARTPARRLPAGIVGDHGSRCNPSVREEVQARPEVVWGGRTSVSHAR